MKEKFEDTTAGKAWADFKENPRSLKNASRLVKELANLDKSRLKTQETEM